MKSLKSLLALLVLSSMVTACSKSGYDSSSAKISGPNDSNKPAGGSPGSEKPDGQNSSEDVKLLLSTMGLSDQMMVQVWSYIFKQEDAAIGNSLKIRSPFSVLKKKLLGHQQNRTGWLVGQTPCKDNKATDLLIEKDQAGLIVKMTLSDVACKAQSKTELATFHWVRKADKSVLRLVMNREGLRDGFGALLAMKGGTSICDFDYTADSKVNKINCGGLGQDRPQLGDGSLVHFEFDQFFYQRVNAKMLMIAGSKFVNQQKACQEQDAGSPSCVRMMVPVDGSIQIFENKIQPGEKEEHDKEARRIEFENAKTKSLMADAEKAAAAEKKKATEKKTTPDQKVEDKGTAAEPKSTVAAPAQDSAQGPSPEIAIPAESSPTMNEQEVRERMGLQPGEPIPAMTETQFLNEMGQEEAGGAEHPALKQIVR